MSANQFCSCKGIRTCLICESSVGKPTIYSDRIQSYFYCGQCGNKAWPSTDHQQHNSAHFVSIEGVFLATNDVISEEKELELVHFINECEWKDSQSGRKKQDFGPKINFKKKVCKVGSFKGLPKYSCDVFTHLQVKYPEQLGDFVPVEVCNLEYVPERGSAIDPHLDDIWIWGPRLVTLNLLSGTVLTLSPLSRQSDEQEMEINIEMPARSLLVLFGEARYKWNHGIKRENITSRRIAITWREFTPLFMPGGELFEPTGRQILDDAKNNI